MIKLHKTNIGDKSIHEIPDIKAGCWIDMIAPEPAEIDQVTKATRIDRDLIVKMLDENETPRIEKSGNATLIVVDTPYINSEHEYITYPLGIIVTKNNYIITISPRRSTILKDFRQQNIQDFSTAKRTRFLIQILNRTAAEYLKVLNTVYQDIERREDTLEKSTNNEDLIGLLNIEKTLVYFITSLKENSTVLEKLGKGNILQLYEGDSDLLEDATIENNQAIDMALIYRDILSTITETYSNIISNNLNNIMKFLAGMTIVISVPTIISSFLGMNVPFGAIGISPLSAAAIFVLSLILSIAVAILLRKKNLL